MEYKLFDKPQFHDKAFHKDRELADHINEPAHALRLYISGAYALYFLRFKEEIKTVGDFGAGNGGLLEFLKNNLDRKDIKLYGYDLMPTNIENAKSKGLDIELKDFTVDDIVYPDFLIMTEILEHLIDPHGQLEKVPKGTYILATVPSYETLTEHYEFHNWVWAENSFFNMFPNCGFELMQTAVVNSIQLVVAKKVRDKC
jgi:2-polyprenyl-3-methyl-5-hydroxy-6-metoxy-1,4-benzoquinol methylase